MLLAIKKKEPPLHQDDERVSWNKRQVRRKRDLKGDD
jgi:hypothetical protein